MKTAVLSCLLLLPAFGFAQKINPAKPDLSPENFRLDSLPDSEINIPIQVNLRPFFEMAERSVDTIFTSANYPDGWVQDGCDTRFKYRFRRSPLFFTGRGSSLDVGFTGHYQITGSTRLCVNGTVVSPWTPACKCGVNEPERRVKVSFTNSVTVTPDYKVRLQVKRNEPEPLDKCEVCFWGQDITKQVMKGLVAELDISRKDMETGYGNVEMRSKFQQVWNELNKTYSIYGLGFLQINPQRFRINNFFIKGDSLNIYLGLSAKPVISFEEKVAAPSPLPNLGPFSRQQGFSVFLDAVLDYDSLGRILNEKIQGKEFEFRKAFIKKKFVIDTCTIYGGGQDKLVIRVDFSGTNKGVVYLVGKPVYKKDSRTIEVEEIDFDIKSRNILLGSADWLFDKKITKEISKQARFELGGYIDTAKTMINTELNKEWTEGIQSRGNIREISLVGLYPLQKHLVVRTNCSGHLSINVDAVRFSL